MTTNPTTTTSMHDTAKDVGEPTTDQTQQAEDASRQLLAKARYDAFRLMTEARDEAETILDEARAEAVGTRKAAELSSSATTTQAESEAGTIVEAARLEAAAIVASAHRTAGEQAPMDDADNLEAEHQALSDRVSTLRTLASQLEDRFAALAATGGQPESEPQHPDVTSATSGPEPVAIDYSPTVAAEPDDEKESEVTEDRQSFYNRRSANLPRLGEDGGRSALHMTRMMRETLETD